MDENEGATGAPANITETIERLEAVSDDLPKRLKQCATFTRRHLHLIAVSTVSDMAEASGVAPSAYIRFCQAVGFSGYSEMQALFRAQYTTFRPGYEQRLAQLGPELVHGSGQLQAEFAEAGQRSLLSIGNSVTNEGVSRVAEGLASGRILHLLGMRRAFAVVSNMSYLLGKMDVPALLHSGVARLDATPLMAAGDSMFAVTFAPFSEEVITEARAAAERGVAVYGLSDSETCPLFEFAREVLVVHEYEIAGFRALNASITLTTALAVLVGARRAKP